MSNYKTLNQALIANNFMRGENVRVFRSKTKSNKDGTHNYDFLKKNQTGFWSWSENNDFSILVYFLDSEKEEKVIDVYAGYFKDKTHTENGFIFSVDKFKKIDSLLNTIHVSKDYCEHVYQGNHSTKTFRLLSADSNFLEDIDEIESNPKLTEPEKKQLISARKGQGKYRKDLMKLWNRCCAVTGLSEETILVASHIKPWAQCKNSAEKLDKYNGLLLMPNLDKLFDKGFITFSDIGKLKISKRLKLEDQKILNLNRDMIITLKKEHSKYLQYHRENVFLK